MTVLHQQKRLLFPPVQILPDFRQCRIHPTVQIQILIAISLLIITISRTLILCDPVRIECLCPCQSLLKITTICALIAHGPDYNTEPVLISFYHLLYPVKDRSLPCRIICDCFIPALKPILFRILLPVQHKRSVCLNISLVNYQKSIFLAHLIEVRCIRIMTGSDCIQIMLLHQSQIRPDLFHISDRPGIRIRIMPVHTPEFYLLSVQIDHTVPDLDRP